MWFSKLNYRGGMCSSQSEDYDMQKKKILFYIWRQCLWLCWFWFRSQEPFLYGRSKYFVSRRIKHKQSLLPEHYLNVIFDVDGTIEDSSGRRLRVTEQYSTSLFVYQPLCSYISKEAHHIPCIFLNSQHSFQNKNIFTTSNRKCTFWNTQDEDSCGSSASLRLQ